MAQSDAAENQPASTVVAYAIFIATGVGVVLPGTLLSTLLQRWSLNDQQAGLLFFLFFIGSSGGSLLARGRLSRSLAAGCAAIAAGDCLLAAASRITAFSAMLVLGLGLGLAMTSISLLQSRRRALHRTSEMARLNLAWALGASIAPTLLLGGVARWPLQSLLYTCASVFAAFALLSLVVIPNPELPPALEARPSQLSFRAIPLTMLLLVPLATGIESSAGGWLASYSKRDGLMLDQTIGTVTCFWAGILLSRLVQSHRVAALVSQRLTLKTAPWLMASGLALLISRQSHWMMLAGSLLLGIGVGPTYPLLLALLLQLGEAGNIIFLAAGIGATVLPLLTGLVSGWSGSLAIGLLVPLVGALAFAFLAAISQRKAAR